jgi:hypothetical protein
MNPNDCIFFVGEYPPITYFYVGYISRFLSWSLLTIYWLDSFIYIDWMEAGYDSGFIKFDWQRLFSQLGKETYLINSRNKPKFVKSTVKAVWKLLVRAECVRCPWLLA